MGISILRHTETQGMRINFSYLPWWEDRGSADEVGIKGVASTHQGIGTHVTGLGVPPVPVWDGEIKISC